MENQDQKPEMPPIVIAAIDAIKLDLETGDTLAMVVRSDDVTAELMKHLQAKLGEMFEGNKVLVFGVGEKEKIDFTVIKANNQNNSCNYGNYCADCTCGKKDQHETSKID